MPKLKSKIPQDLVCPECGSKKVLTEIWINPNRISIEVTSDDFGGAYCEDCQKYVDPLISKDEYQKLDS